jgi:hypothetical protein
MRMNWLLSAALTLAAVSVQAAPVETIATVDTGAVIYYGVELHRPFLIGIAGEDMVISCPADSVLAASGMEWLPWCLDSTGTKSANEEYGKSAVGNVSPLNALFAKAEATSDAEGVHGMPRAERIAGILRQSSLVDSAMATKTAAGPGVQVFIHGGLPILSMVDGVSSMTPPATPYYKAMQHAARVIRSLKAGRLLIVDYGIECSVPPESIGVVMAELKSYPSGRPPVIIKNETIVRRFQSRFVPLRELVRGKE